MAEGLVDGTVLYTDSTHLKANANKNKLRPGPHCRSSRRRLGRLMRRSTRTAKPTARGRCRSSGPPSRTDQGDQGQPHRQGPGYMVRDGKPKGFFYLDHRTVDGRRIITDTHVTPANVHDSVPYLGQARPPAGALRFPCQRGGLDAGYATAAIAQGLEERSILGVTGYRRPTPPHLPA